MTTFFILFFMCSFIFVTQDPKHNDKCDIDSQLIESYIDELVTQEPKPKSKPDIESQMTEMGKNEYYKMQ